MHKFILFGLLLFAMSFAGAQFYDGSNMQFGKNRVQYDEFEWQYFRFKNYETYFYTGGKEIAIYSAKAAKRHISEIERFLEFYNHESIRYILYNKYDHYKQSNIGIVDEHNNLGGVNKVIGTKVFLYFEGDHQKLERDLKAGTAEVLLSNYLYGGDWRNIVRNSDMYKMPEWYFGGLISYLSRGWDTEVNDIVKDGTLSGRYRKLVQLEGDEATYAGHSVWKYIADTYGESVIANILFVTKINRDVESGFLYVLGVNLKDLMEEWNNYLKEKYNKDQFEVQMPNESILKTKTRKNRKYYEIKLDPNGRYFAFANNRKGKKKLFIYDTQLDKRKKIFKHGIKLDRPTHYLYPKIAWHPTGEILAYVYQKKGKLLLNFYDLESKKTISKKIFLMEDILSISYSSDGKQMVFSGVYEGQSDIYLYNIAGNTQQKITNDRFDDLDPVFFNNSKEIMFSSNRTTTDLKSDRKEIDTSSLKTDLYLYKIGKSETELRKVTDTKEANEMNPIEYEGKEVYYLSDESGVLNIYKTRYDSTIRAIDTSIHYDYYFTKDEMSEFKRNIQEFTSTGVPGEEAFLFFENKRHQLKKGSLIKDADSGLSESDSVGEHLEDKGLIEGNFEEMKLVYLNKENLPGEIDIRRYKFEDKEVTTLSYEKEVIVFDKLDDSQEEGIEDFILPQQRNYNLSFFKDESILQINNTYLTQQYQKFNPPYQSPGVGVTMVMGISDLFEDHKIYGGVRLGSSSHEYMLSYQNLKRRLDKEYYGGILNSNYEIQNIEYKNRTLRAAVVLKYPFTEVSSMHFVFDGRRDRATPQARDITGLQAPLIDDYWGTYRMAYVYDNTRDKGLNIKFGTRYKIYGEAYQKMNDDQVNINVVGLDIRHYQRIHREAIFVSRIASSTSFGTGKLVYYMGGVDNWMANNKFNFDQPISNNENYMFQANATNLRGFQQNIRNGNSMVVVNTELRWPVFRYFIRRPMRSAFLKNFQLTGFGDIGTAWTGSDPYSEENDQIKDVINNGPVTITLTKSNEPIVGSYGFGVRMAIMGYFMRIDWAWGIENDVVLDRMVHFSLSLDL